MNLLKEAVDWYNAGYMPVPARADGTKAPGVTTWRDWQDCRPDLGTVVDLFTRTDTDGLGLLCGAVSGQLEMIELEQRAVEEGYLDRLAQAFTDHDMAALWEKVETGYAEQTPSGGLHWYYRVDGPAARNTKLARRPATPEELQASPEKTKVLIETRGQGGFTVIAPSAGRTHKSGNPWQVIAGSPAGIPTLTVEERDTIFEIANLLDEVPAVEWSSDSSTPAIKPSADELRPGDDYNHRGTWADLLQPRGWSLAHRWPSGRLGWTRPGKHARDGLSATTGGAKDGVDRLYVFSSSTEFEPEKPYTLFSAYTLLEHGGDFAAATRALRAAGYGTPPKPDQFSTLTLLPGERLGMPDNVIPISQGSTAPVLEMPAREPVMDLLERLTREELLKLRARNNAREMLATEMAPPAEPFDLDTLAAILARPEDPPMRIDQLMPWSAAMLLIAQRKAGKTTLELNLARSLVTGEDFLGCFEVRPIAGTVALLNYEVSARQIATWAAEHEVPNERLILVNLRGRRNPLADPQDAKRLAAELRARNVESVIVDPFGRAYTGQSQNDAGEVGSWLVRLDQFVRGDVGALDLILTAHAGWNGERTRGSSALEDWADVLVNITREHDDDEQTTPDRYFRAEGRDVEIAEDRLRFDQATRTLTLCGFGGRRKGRESKRMAGLAGPIMEIVTTSPGITYRDLLRRLRDALGGVRDADVSAAIRHLIDTGQAYRADAPNGKPKPIFPGQQPLGITK